MSEPSAIPKKFIVVFSGEEQGPYSASELRNFIREGHLKAETSIRFENSDQLVSALSIFSADFPKAVSPGSMPGESINSGIGQALTGSGTEVPPEALQFSWAGFLGGIIWAAVYQQWIWAGVILISLFIPFAPIVATIAFGIFARRLAWAKGSWKSVEEMNRKGKKWVAVILSLWATIFGGIIFFSVILPILIGTSTR